MTFLDMGIPVHSAPSLHLPPAPGPTWAGQSMSHFFFSATPHGMWDLSFPTRDGTRAPCTEGAVLASGQLEKPPRARVC